jgi:hypothetical protein
LSTLASVIERGLYSALPAASIPGRLYFASDTGHVYRDNGTSWDDVTATSGSGLTENIGLVVDGGGSAITTGTKGFISVPYNATIQSVTMLADQSGSVVVDIWKTTYSSYQPGVHPVVADSITASDLPTLSSAYKMTDSALTGWTTTISAGDILQFVINSAATITRLVLLFEVARA